MSIDQSQYCTFHVDNLYLGIEVQKVQEVIRYQAMTKIPLAPPAIQGLINLRGQIVTAIDLRYCLGLPPRGPGQQPMNVVVRDGENAISLLVDRIGDVVEVEESDFEPPPATRQALQNALGHRSRVPRVEADARQARAALPQRGSTAGGTRLVTTRHCHRGTPRAARTK